MDLQMTFFLIIIFIHISCVTRFSTPNETQIYMYFELRTSWEEPHWKKKNNKKTKTKQKQDMRLILKWAVKCLSAMWLLSIVAVTLFDDLVWLFRIRLLITVSYWTLLCLFFILFFLFQSTVQTEPCLKSRLT